MNSVSLSSSADQAFDPFLQESFGVEEHGMTVSVMSALARLGLDPWAEARRLASLPKQAAAAALARHLALSGDSAIATRLAGMLPRGAMVQAPAGDRMTRINATVRKHLLLAVALWLGASVLFVVATGPSKHAPADATVAIGVRK